MKIIKLLTFSLILLTLFSCDAVQKATNSTGGVFSLTGQWQLTANTPENTLIGSKVTVAPIVSEAAFTSLVNNTQCYRENDIKWKNILTDKNGGFTVSQLLSNCTAGTLNYQPASIYVVNSNEIRLTGKNAEGLDNTQTWKRVSK